MPPLGHFTGYIQIVIPGIGASNKTAKESRIVSVLQMTGVSPDTGSRFGNTQINITGVNFGVDPTKVLINQFSQLMVGSFAHRFAIWFVDLPPALRITLL